jgi:hypothetical protein
MRMHVGSIGLDFGTYTNGTSWIQNRIYNNYASNYNLVLQPNGGNLGIGTASPFSTLTVLGGDVSASYNTAMSLISDTAANQQVLNFGTSKTGGYSFIRSYQLGVGEENLILNPLGGNVGIGTASPGTYKIYINGTGYLNTTAWAYSSDRRLKENISFIQSGLSIIEQLKPVKFDYIKGEKKQAGFIAQEVQKVLPDIITKGEDGMLAMKTESIIPYLVKAVQEQQKEIEELKSQVKALKRVK